ncbi:hypothetical protein EMPS_03093 [Entomortierella parvispora]|uniref:Uncharacterized protein n=1 Tax=Entomortierella parvispora TaxID=205924 RepID=A0A9P3H656_9FUNG|nr:hypothetical protein EMPS_03093 [Entomortierella parvispora]
MWSITFYSIAPLVLCVMIMNAAEPVIDYSHLHKPTATISTFPPLAAPAPRIQSPQAGGGAPGLYILNSNHPPKERSLLAFSTKWLSSVTSSPVSFIKHLSRRSSSSFPSSTAEIDLDEISTDFNTEEMQQEKRPPSRSRYSPPAVAYYAEDESIRQHHIYLQQQHQQQQQQQQHPQQQQQSVHPDSLSFNKSELCHSAAGTKVPTPQDNNNNNHSPQTRNLDDPGKIPVGDWHLMSALHNKPPP